LIAAPPPATAWRLPPAPEPNPVRELSPSTTVTSSNGTPSRSAITCASDVTVPWPWEKVVVIAVTRPFASIRTWAMSDAK
jgi:hypothetical protein